MVEDKLLIIKMGTGPNMRVVEQALGILPSERLALGGKPSLSNYEGAKIPTLELCGRFPKLNPKRRRWL